MKKSKIVLLALLLSISSAFFINKTHAICTIHLTDGRVIKSEYCEESESTLYYHKYGSQIGIPRGLVESFSMSEDEITDGDSGIMMSSGGSGGYRPETDAKLIFNLQQKYSISIQPHSFKKLHLYMRDIKPNLTIEEQFLVVHKMESDRIEWLKSFQKQYDRSIGKNQRQDRKLNRQLLTHKLAVHGAESCIAHLIKYTESNPESAQFIDKYSAEQLE